MERSSHSTGFLSSLLTFFVVTVMSLLVWIYAESRTVKPTPVESHKSLSPDSPIQTFELAPVPVVLSINSDVAKRYSLSIDESEKHQTGLTLSGPPWLIEQVLPLSQAIRADVEVTETSISTAKQGQVTLDPVIRGVPNGLTVKGMQPVPVNVKPVN